MRELGERAGWSGYVPASGIPVAPASRSVLRTAPGERVARRLEVDPETDEWKLLELSVRRRVEVGDAPRYPTAGEYASWSDEQLAALRLDPEDWVATVTELDPFDVGLIDPNELADLPGADEVLPEVHPINIAMERVQLRQAALREAEAERVLAALGTWRVALASVTGTPDAMVNGMVHKAVMLQLATSLQIAEQTASELVHTAEDLETDLPLTWARFVAGGVPWRGMQMVHAAIDGLDPQFLPAFDEKAADAVVRVAMPKLRDRLHQIRERLQAVTAVDRHVRALRGRQVTLEPAADGMAWLSNLMPAPEAIAIDHALSTAAIAAHGTEGETRSVQQLRSDILTDLWVEGARHDATEKNGVTVPARRGVQAKIAVLIPAMTALGVSECPATLQGYGPIDMDTAKRLAGNAKSWIRVLTDPVTGAVMTIGRKKYKPTADMRTLLGLLDGGGRGPNCRRPPGQTDADHVTPFHQGFARGQTALDNLVLLSRRDHMIKTSGLWGIELREGRDLAWTSFYGTRIITTIEPLEPTPVPDQYLHPPSTDADPPPAEARWTDDDELDCPF